MARSQHALRFESRAPRVSGVTIPEGQVDLLLSALAPVVEAVGATVGPYCEVVLHDLRVPERSIHAIANGAVTGRRAGGPVVGGPVKDIALGLLDFGTRESSLTVGYTTHTTDGRELRSTSLVLRSPQGRPVVALCVNVDLSAVTMARQLLDEIARPGGEAAVPSKGEQAPPDVDEIVAHIIQEAIDKVGTPVRYMEREQRLRAVRLMHERGLFLIRGGVERVAAALGISRFTLYSYLKEVRNT